MFLGKCLAQTIWTATHSCRHKSNNFESRQGWGLQAEAYSLLCNFHLHALTVSPVWGTHPSVSRGHVLQLMGSCTEVGTLKPGHVRWHLTFISPTPKPAGGPRLMLLHCASWRSPRAGCDTSWAEHTETFVTAAGATCRLKGFLSSVGPGSLTLFVNTVLSFLKNIKTVNKFFLICLEWNYIVL